MESLGLSFSGCRFDLEVTLHKAGVRTANAKRERSHGPVKTAR